MDKNYLKIVEKIAKGANLEIDEVKRQIEAKRAKLSDLISYEGAAQVVAAELGISFDNQKLKIDELLPGMRKSNVSGKIVSLFPIRSYKNKKGEDSKVLNFILADDTSNIKVVLWDTNHIAMFENDTLKEGSVVEIFNGSMRDNELHLGSFSEIKASAETFDSVMTEKVVHEKPIVDFRIGDSANARAFVVQSFEPRFFYVCPQCKKKANTDGENYVCVEHGKVVPEKRALINIVIDDGTETIRAVSFHDNLAELGLTELDDSEKINLQRENLLGKEFIFGGNVRRNNYFNNEEFIINEVKQINHDDLILKLEKK